MVERRYSDIVELIDIGTSYEGRHLLVIKVSPSLMHVLLVLLCFMHILALR